MLSKAEICSGQFRMSSRRPWARPIDVMHQSPVILRHFLGKLSLERKKSFVTKPLVTGIYLSTGMNGIPCTACEQASCSSSKEPVSQNTDYRESGVQSVEDRALSTKHTFVTTCFFWNTTVVLKMRTCFKRCVSEKCIAEIYVPWSTMYPKFQLGERGPKATAIPEYLVKPAIKHHVRVPNSRCHRTQITESLE